MSSEPRTKESKMVALLAKKLDEIADKKVLKFADKESANALWAAVRKRRDGIEDCSHTRDLQSASGKTSGLRRGKKPKKAQPKKEKDTRTLDLFDLVFHRQKGGKR